MYISIYQINSDRDEDMVKFEDLGNLPKKYNGQPNADLYDNVFNGFIKAVTLEDVYDIFNMDQPEGFRGHSLSVSDIVVVRKSDSVQPGAYFVSNIGFRKVTFVSSPSYDAVFWEIPTGKGLTADMLEEVAVWITNADAFIPAEFTNIDMTASALGFITPRSAPYETWIKREVMRVLENEETEKSAVIITIENVELSAYLREPIKIRLIRE